MKKNKKKIPAFKISILIVITFVAVSFMFNTKVHIIEKLTTSEAQIQHSHNKDSVHEKV